MKPGKLIYRIVLAVVLLVVVAVGIVVLLIDPMAKSAVEKGGQYALGVPTNLDRMNIYLLRGEMTMDGLNISNPEGFDTPHLMDSGRFDLGVDTGSIFTDTVVVKKFILDGLDLNVEQKVPKSNVSVVLENIRRLGGDGKEKKPEKGKNVKVDEILIKNVTAHFHLTAGIKERVDVKVPEIRLKNVSTGEGGAAVAQVIRRVLPAVIEAVLAEGGDRIPADLRGSLNSHLDSARKALGRKATQIMEEMKLPDGVQDSVDKEVKDRLKDIMPGQKDEQ